MSATSVTCAYRSGEISRRLFRRSRIYLTSSQRPLGRSRLALGFAAALAFAGSGVFEQVLDQVFEFFFAEDFAEVLRHHVRRVALGDFLVRVDHHFFDDGGGVARNQSFFERRAGDAAGAGGFEGVAAAAAVAGEDLGAGAAFDFRRGGAGDAGPFADVGGDVVEVLAGD